MRACPGCVRQFPLDAHAGERWTCLECGTVYEAVPYEGINDHAGFLTWEPVDMEEEESND